MIIFEHFECADRMGTEILDDLVVAVSMVSFFFESLEVLLEERIALKSFKGSGEAAGFFKKLVKFLMGEALEVSKVNEVQQILNMVDGSMGYWMGRKNGRRAIIWV